MFFLLYRQNDIDKMKYKFWREISEITSPMKVACEIMENKTPGSQV